jgi:hypothetical protein
VLLRSVGGRGAVGEAWLAALALLLVMGTGGGAQADDGTGEGAAAIEVHAFVSQGVIKSTGNNYLTESKRGSVEFNEIGINFTKALGDRLQTGIQFFARDLGPVGNYTPKVDWAYLDYRFADWLGFRAGRLKVPFGLYNENNDVDSARVPVLLPQSVYPILNRDILLAQTGAELYGYARLGPAGGLEYRLYGGTLYIDPPIPKPPLQLQDFQVPYVFGGRLLWETPLEGLRAGAGAQALRFDSTYTIPGAAGMPPTPLTIGLPFVLWLASIEYAAHDLLLAAEYGRWKADVESNLGPTTQTVNERFYVMGAYRVSPWFMPGMYYSSLVPNVDKRGGRETYQEDIAMTLRFDLNAHWIFKLESHYMLGTADLSSDLNGGTPLDKLPKSWSVLFAKTTVYY